MHSKPNQLHPRNKHQGQYDFDSLIKVCPELAPWVLPAKSGKQSIDFFEPNAVKSLNQALLKQYYQIEWQLPKGYLCPPIPGRADYIHYLADLLAEQNKGLFPRGKKIRCLDVGVGANCIYPILGNQEYGWTFVGSDIYKKSIQYAQTILDKNVDLESNIELRWQAKSQQVFKGIIAKDELFDLTICNPPFHRSAQEAETAALRKLGQLKQQKTSEVNLNFGGQANELWCNGGEKTFIQKMMRESQLFAHRCCWFTSLVSKSSNLKDLHQLAKQLNVTQIRTIPMAQGNKKSRLIAWTFLEAKPMKYWSLARF